MQYNLKVFEYADNRKQIRIYSNTIEKNTKRMEEITEKRNNVRQIKKQLGVVNETDDSWSAYVSKNRTIQNIYHICRSNKFEWFITFTFDEKRVDRYNYDDCMNAAKSWIQEVRRKYHIDLKYVLIPEMHKDKAWHIHALFGDLGEIKVKEAVYSGGKHKGKLKIVNGMQVYDIESYFYGFVEATKVKDNFAAISYMTKYITKELCTEIKNRKRYITSQNLNKPVVTEHIISKYDKDSFISALGQKILDIQEKDFNDETITYIEIDGCISELSNYDLETRKLSRDLEGDWDV